MGDQPPRFADAEALEDFMTAPRPELSRDLAAAPGDMLVLGAGGKMGPTLARLAKRAAPDRRVVAVSRFSEPKLRKALEGHGVETIACDLLDREAVEELPRAANVIFMAGRKFGAGGDLPFTWAMNAHVPTIVAETFRESRIVAFSTGNVYPHMPVAGGGAREDTPPSAIGEYAQSCLGRERLFSYFSQRFGTPGRLIRLNYAIDLRYGVLHDIAVKVLEGAPIDLTTGHVNVIWQGDANSHALRALRHCTVPASPLNVTGPETASVRTVARAMAERLGREPRFTGAEAAEGWLNDAGEAARLFGFPSVRLSRMIDWVADWVASGGDSLGKPTAYEVRDGSF